MRRGRHSRSIPQALPCGLCFLGNWLMSYDLKRNLGLRPTNRPLTGTQCGNANPRSLPARMAIWPIDPLEVPPSPNHRFVIALHSPDGTFETGLRMCPAEKFDTSRSGSVPLIRQLLCSVLCSAEGQSLSVSSWCLKGTAFMTLTADEPETTAVLVGSHSV